MTLNEQRMDILREMINIGFGQAAGALNKMSGSHVELSAPEVLQLDHCRLADWSADRGRSSLDIVKLDFSGGMEGAALLLFERESADNLVALLTRGMDIPLEEMRQDTLREVGNVALVWVTAAVSNLLGETLCFHPLTSGDDLERMLPGECRADAGALLIKTGFKLEDRLVHGEMLLLFTFASLEDLIRAIDALADEQMPKTA